MPDKASLCYIRSWSHGSLSVDSLVGSLVPRSSEGYSYLICCSSYGVAIPFSSFNPSPNSSIDLSGLSPMVGCKYLHLSQSVVVRTSQRTAMLHSCLQAQHDICNSVRVSCLHLGCIPNCNSHCVTFPSVSAPFLSLHFH